MLYFPKKFHPAKALMSINIFLSHTRLNLHSEKRDLQYQRFTKNTIIVIINCSMAYRISLSIGEYANAKTIASLRTASNTAMYA